MNRNSIYLVILLSTIWIILTESLAIWSMVAGIAISAACVYLCYRLFDMERISNVNFWRLIIYVFYLIGQIYLAGFAAIKLIIKGADAHIVRTKTSIDNEYLRVLLANSITLTPGTITLGSSGDRLTVLWLRGKERSAQDAEDAGELIKGKLEKQLLKAQKRK